MKVADYPLAANDSSASVLGINSASQVKRFRTVSPVTVNVADYGADPSATVDSAPAIQNAINSLGTRGGNVFVPAGIYRINSTINLGDGSAGAVSSRWGINLTGEGSPVTTTNGTLADGGNGTSLLMWGGTNGGGPLLSVNGPLDGWGLQNLEFDSTFLNTTATMLRIMNASRGSMSNCTLRGGQDVGFLLSGWRTGAFTGNNFFSNIFFAMPNGNANQSALKLAGAGTSGSPQGEPIFNTFINCCVVQPNLAAANYGIYLAFCDNNYFVGWQTTGGGTGSRSVAFDYSAVTNFPSANGFVCFDSSFVPVELGTVPILMNAPNLFYAMTRGNGLTIAGLKNVSWFDGRSSKTIVVTVADLDAVTNNTGARAVVNNANATTFNSIVVGGGSNTVPVFCDGTNWRIG
jgi:pectate lyase-like protein